jgi:G:T-mismatch repair DNA endonuclease (very short patch repair protein)
LEEEMVLSKKQREYVYSEENIARLKQNRKNQKESPFKGHTWEGKTHPRGFKGHKHTKEDRKKMSHLGQSNPMYGVRLEKNVKRMKENNPMKNPEIAKKVHQKTDKMTKERMKDEEYKKWWLKTLRSGLVKPTQPEKVMMHIIKENNLPFNYVGTGNIWFKGYGTMFNPDFLSKNPKHIIEVFGDYWHNLPERKKLDEKRIETYKKYGYKTLVIWEYELVKNKKPLKDFSHVIDKINKFVGGY